MFINHLFAAGLLATFVVSMPGKVNEPISESEWKFLNDGGLKGRSAAKINMPITDAEMELLNSTDFKARGLADPKKKDKIMHCGKLMNGQLTTKRL